MGKSVWTIDGIAFPRNPDFWSAKYDPANVSYVTMADGSIRRIVVPFKQKSVPVEFDFTYADQRIRNFVLQQLNSDVLHKITFDGELPAKQVWCYLDTPEVAMSKTVFDTRVGQGGGRRDIKIMGRTDGPYAHSANIVPNRVVGPNLLADTNFQLSQWTLGGGSLAVASGAGPNGTNAIQETGNGTSVFGYYKSSAVNVIPGQWYVLSGYVDGTNVTAGQPGWGLYTSDLNTFLTSITTNPGSSGRTVQIAWRCPPGVTQVVAVAHTYNATVTNGTKLTWANPQFEYVAGSSSVASTYTANLTTLPQLSRLDINLWFSGPYGSQYLDYIPSWDGNAYNIALPVNASATFSNLGTAPWSPVIRINGPFNSGLQIKAAYQDVDGTGQGVVLTYAGAALASGSYLLFDTLKCRMWAVIGGAQNEIYTFTLTTVANGTPFPYWPPFPIGEFTLTTAGVGGTTAASMLDLSNNGTETFRYWL